MNKYSIISILGWAIIAGIQTGKRWALQDWVSDLQEDIKFLKAENARLEKAASKEPSTVEAVAALTAKCRRMKTCSECHGKSEPIETFCDYGRQTLPETFPYAMAQSGDGIIGNAVEIKVKEYMEAQS